MKDPHEVVKAGQVVKVKVLEVDVKRRRIGLTMKLNDSSQAASSGFKSDRGERGDRNSIRPSSHPSQQRSASPQGNTAFAAAFEKLKAKQ